MIAEELEREYSPSSAIGGNYSQYIEQYIEKSESARERCPRTDVLSYGPRPSNTIDVVVPEGAKSCPVVVFIHGGYWQELSKYESFIGADAFVARGIGYAAVDYSLAPNVGMSEIVDECRAALRCLAVNAQALGIDKDQFFLAGSSAGAHLCAMCCAGRNAGKTRFDPRIAGTVLLSGIFCLEPLVETTINRALGMSVGDARDNSPGLLELSSFPDAIVSWGGV